MSNTTKSVVEANKGKRKGKASYAFITFGLSEIDIADSGTRSVSTLTPSQLARKRANDREAQRAIRARTKEHIESLEREIEELRSLQNRDQTIQTLLRRNKALEEELCQIRGNMGINATGEQYQPVFNSSSPPGPHSFGQPTSHFSMIQNIAPYSNISDATDAWPATVPCSISSTASSPTSSAATDDFGSNYIPSGSSTTVYERSSLPPNGRSPTACSNGDAVFDDTKPGFGCTPINIMPINPNYHFQPWNMYPMQQYQSSQTTLGNSQPISQMRRCPF
ncbi:hypothetical protein F4774DRAFT_413779 [Daldinia eschscholtzii]|nr:hypothetical protein F4774DRAFT_413779 [Daldinia eschscholtzii]